MLARSSRLPSGLWWLLGALAIAAASLPFGRALAFDPSAWVVWGREVWHLDLDTNAGPSWKPFPVLLTAPLSVLGDGTGAAWLVVARAGALLAVVGAGRLAGRAVGPWGAAVAAVAVLASPWWLLNGALGNADPLLGALVAWALLAAADDAPRRAFALGALGALVRPEIWPFLAVYGLVLVARRRLPLVPVLLVGAGVLALWVVPDLLSSGLKSTRGATGMASAGSASLTDVPFLTVWKDLGRQAPWVALVAALVGAAAVAGRGRRRRLPLRSLPAADPRTWLLLAGGYALLVAVMAQAGFAGNPRYLVPALTLVAAAAGTVVGLPAIVGRLAADRAGRAGRDRAVAEADGAAATTATDGTVSADGGGPAAARPTADRSAAGPGAAVPLLAALVVAVLVAVGWGDLRDQARTAGQRADARRQLAAAIDAAGGQRRLRRCGPVRSGPAARTLVAELLHESVPQAALRPRPGDAAATLAATGRWTIVAPDCR